MMNLQHYLMAIGTGSGIIGTLIFVLDLVAIVSVLLGRGSVGHKVLWIVLILLLPVVGVYCTS